MEELVLEKMLDYDDSIKDLKAQLQLLRDRRASPRKAVTKTLNESKEQSFNLNMQPLDFTKEPSALGASLQDMKANLSLSKNDSQMLAAADDSISQNTNKLD